jgi:intracellular septation protein
MAIRRWRGSDRYVLDMNVIQKYLDRQVVFELLPAAVFFAANAAWGIRTATILVMVATTAVILAGYTLDRRIPLIALATLVIVLVLGGAALYFDDARFVKIKPTVGKCLFAAALLVGLAFRPSFIERVLGHRLRLTPAGWRGLTYCWIAYALFLAALNEVLWRSFDTDIWVAFKTLLVPVSIVGYVAITRAVAPIWWDAEHEPPSSP